MFSRIKNKMSQIPFQEYMTYGPAAITGGAAAVKSAIDEEDPIGTTALKSIAAGTMGALAGRYGTPILAEAAKQGARNVKNMTQENVNNLRNAIEGKGYLSAALGVPAAALGGTLAYQGARALNVPLDVARAPGFQNEQSYQIDQANAAYEAAIQQEMEAAYLEGAMNAPIDPEALGSSNTIDARMYIG